MSTPAQIAANRANAQRSTGPTTEAGKAKVAINSIKSGLTGRTVVLPSDDVAEYQRFLAHFAETWKPVGLTESNLVQAIADAEWRLCRIPSLERGIYAMAYGELPLADTYAAETDPTVRQGILSLIEAQIFVIYERQLTNLSNQANRIRRHRAADIAALKQLQAERAQADQARLEQSQMDQSQMEQAQMDQSQMEQAATAYAAAVRTGQAANWNPQAIGFEFPMNQIEQKARTLHPETFQKKAA